MSHPRTQRNIGEYTHLQEDIQLLSDVVDCGDLGLCFLDKIVFFLLELPLPPVEPGETGVRMYLGKEQRIGYLWRSESSKFNLLIISW